MQYSNMVLQLLLKFCNMNSINLNQISSSENESWPIGGSQMWKKQRCKGPFMSPKIWSYQVQNCVKGHTLPTARTDHVSQQ